MTPTTIIVLSVLGLIVLIVDAPALFVFIAVRLLKHARIEPLADHEFVTKLAPSRADDEWALKNGFAWLGAYRFIGNIAGKVTLFVWWVPDLSTFFVKYFAPQGIIAYDLVTYFEYRHPKHGTRASVTTTSVSDGLLMPLPPMAYTQAFPSADHDGRFRLHIEAEQFIGRALNTDVLAQDANAFPTLVLDAIHAQADHIRGMPLWPMRALWWFLTKGRKANRTIAQQHPLLAAMGTHAMSASPPPAA